MDLKRESEVSRNIYIETYPPKSSDHPCSLCPQSKEHRLKPHKAAISCVQTYCTPSERFSELGEGEFNSFNFRGFYRSVIEELPVTRSLQSFLLVYSLNDY